MRPVSPPLVPDHLGAPSEHDLEQMFMALCAFEFYANDGGGDDSMLRQFEQRLHDAGVPPAQLRALGFYRLRDGRWPLGVRATPSHGEEDFIGGAGSASATTDLGARTGSGAEA
jgi:hypothetical protein